MSGRTSAAVGSNCDNVIGKLRTCEEIVQHYISEKRPQVNRDLAYFKSLSLRDAIRCAALAKRPDGKRRDHQRRLSKQTLADCERRLQKCQVKLRGCQTFTVLHDLIESEIREVPGVGPLAVYDTAVNIGANLGLEPELIYLHAGTKVGARLLGLGARRKTLERSELPKEFQRLKPRELEDCLCSYADSIREICSRPS